MPKDGEETKPRKKGRIKVDSTLSRHFTLGRVAVRPPLLVYIIQSRPLSQFPGFLVALAAVLLYFSRGCCAMEAKGTTPRNASWRKKSLNTKGCRH